MAFDGQKLEFEDHFPSMIGNLGAEGFMEELCAGFRVLMDVEKGVITLESLRRSIALLELEEMEEEEMVAMVKEGDIDGDGVLSLMEFCVLMFRLSPALMDISEQCWFLDFVPSKFFPIPLSRVLDQLQPNLAINQ